MKKPQIIQSLLDTDLYKLTMQMAVWKLFPDIIVKYKFKCRNKSIDFSPFIDRINRELDALCRLKFRKIELNYLRNLKSSHQTNIFRPMFVQYLEHFKLNRSHIKAYIDAAGELQIEINGPWLATILFETPVLAIVNEVYFSQYGGMKKIPKLHGNQMDAGPEGHARVEAKIELLNQYPDFLFAEFGTRRRFSREWQQYVLRRILDKAPGAIAGTSNLLFAMDMGLTPIGTMAHEWLQAGQALARPRDSVIHMLDSWVKVYRGDLGIALTDVISSRIFFEDFGLFYSKLFDGVRHDSGDPVDYGYMTIKHYNNMNIDPRSKTIVFSDGLTIRSAIDLQREFDGKIKTGFGIGTSVTNDVGHAALNIVLKMTECNGQSVAKISDTPGKGVCEDEAYIAFLRGVFEI